MQSSSAAVSWHVRRARAMHLAHPEIKALVGNEPRSAIAIVALVVLQLGIAAALAGVPVWLAALLGWAFGAIAAHALGVAIHELAHDLVFRKKWANMALAIFANLPLGFPGAIDFRDKHLRHHRHLGDLGGADTQAPTVVQARLAEHGPLGRLAWLAFGPLVFHGQAGKGVARPRRAWFVANAVACFALWPIVFAYSPSSFVYLCVGAFMAFGPHPVGIRRYAEHVVLARGQPTASYYGAWNWLCFNVGHHVEHHDHPGVPWTRLGKLRAIAPEHYERLAKVRSWTGILLAFAFDERYGVGRYVQRDFLERLHPTAPAESRAGR